VTAMRSFEVVEAEVVLEVSRHGPQAAVVGAPERTAPQLGQDGALQTLDEAVGPWVAWPSTTMLDLEALARRHEHALELGPAVGGARAVRPVSSPSCIARGSSRVSRSHRVWSPWRPRIA